MFDLNLSLDLETIKLFAPLLIINALLIIICLFDIIKNKDNRENKILWLVVVLLINIVGPVLYLVLGSRTNK